MVNDVKHELQNILRGTRKVGKGNLIQTTASYLRKSAEAGEMVAGSKPDKREEATRLINFAKENNLWIEDINLKNYISEGAEQKVFLNPPLNVFKLTDAIYYESWTDYFHSLMLNNFFFPDTFYELKGFTEIDKKLFALVEQPYVEADEPTNLEKVKLFMEANGFRNVRNHDYVHDVWGIILEDLHDENVLTKEGMLYFIDTVFFLKPNFWYDADA